MRAALGLGANLGDMRSALNIAVGYLIADPWVGQVARSSFYRTDPVGGPEQPEYVNAVAVVDTRVEASPIRTAEHLLSLAQHIENELQRVREIRWGPRTIDVDVLAVEQLTSLDPRLTVPHPRIADRAFVLIPWMEIDPDFVIPALGSVAEVAAQLPPTDHEGVRRLVH